MKFFHFSQGLSKAKHILLSLHLFLCLMHLFSIAAIYASCYWSSTVAFEAYFCSLKIRKLDLWDNGAVCTWACTHMYMLLWTFEHISSSKEKEFFVDYDVGIWPLVYEYVMLTQRIHCISLLYFKFMWPKCDTSNRYRSGSVHIGM